MNGCDCVLIMLYLYRQAISMKFPGHIYVYLLPFPKVSIYKFGRCLKINTINEVAGQPQKLPSHHCGVWSQDRYTSWLGSGEITLWSCRQLASCCTSPGGKRALWVTHPFVWALIPLLGPHPQDPSQT